MNRTGQYLSRKKNILSIYFTADYPEMGCTKDIILGLQHAGVDMIEVGIPFSDPLADGPVIQQSSKQALENGFTLQNLFNELKLIQFQINIPLVLMGYFNTMIAFGLNQFLAECEGLGIDSVIIPDLPPDDYTRTYAATFAQYHVSPVFLITPQTSESRIKLIDSMSNAFIYAVADNSITGSNKDLTDAQLTYFQKIKETFFKVPLLIGFGIADRKGYLNVCEYAQGAIIGSAFIRSLGTNQNITDSIQDFIHTIKQEDI